MAPELAITAASPWLEPGLGADPRVKRAGTARRGPGLRFFIALALIVAIGLAAVTISARGVPTAALGKRYSVTVAVDFKPYDPALWAIMNAEDYDAALALDPSLPSPDSVDWANAAAAPEADLGRLREEAYVGPPAKAYVFRGVTPLDRQRAHYCLTAAIYYEAASETDDGMRGVAQTVLNRVRHPSFPNTVCGVVFQGSQRAGVCQFTFSCDGAMARAPSQSNWARASRIAADALAGRVFASVGLATHYHTQAIWPRWGKSLVMTNIVGAHIFHRWRGRWGTPEAFRAPYAGREPVPGPYLPVAQQVAILSGRAPAQGAAALLPPGSGSVPGSVTAPLVPPIAVPAPTPQTMGSAAPVAPAAGPAPRRAPEPRRDYVDPALNQSGQIREEFRGSGEWIK
jgi:hypothetical protein